MVRAAVALMLALTWGGRRYAWMSPQIVALFAASVTLWALFAARVMTAREPFIPLSVLRDGAMRVGTAAAFFAVGTVIALTIVLPLYAQLALGLSVSGSGWAIIALQGAATITSIVGGRLLVRFTHYKRVPLVGLLLSIAALVPLALAPTGFSPAAALGLIALVGLGLGATFPFTIVVVQNAVALHQLGVATGTMNFFRARFDLHRRRLRCDRARGHAGEPRDVGGGGAGGHGCRRSLPMGLRRRHSLSRDRAGLHSGARGAAAAGRRIGRPRSNDRACARHTCPVRVSIVFTARRGDISRRGHGNDWSIEQILIGMTSSSRKSSICNSGKPAESNSHASLSHAHVRNIFYGLMLGMFLSALNQTIVATALPTIGRDFGDFENLSWVIIAYLLSSTVVSPLYGKLSDIHGRRAMMLAAIGLFIAGSVVSAAAPTMGWLIAGRTLQGIGGGGIVPLTQTTIADMITPRERGRYQAYMGTSWIVAGVAGPVLGGLIAEHLHWSMIFWLQRAVRAPRGAAHPSRHEAAAAARAATPARHRRRCADDRGGDDLLIALTSGGTRVSWLSRTRSSSLRRFRWRSALLSSGGSAGTRAVPPLTVLRNPVMRAGTAATSWMMGAVLGLTVYMPLYFQVVHKLFATEAGVALIPIVLIDDAGSRCCPGAR